MHSLLGNLAQQYFIRIVIAGRHKTNTALHTPSLEGVKICCNPFRLAIPVLTKLSAHVYRHTEKDAKGFSRYSGKPSHSGLNC